MRVGDQSLINGCIDAGKSPSNYRMINNVIGRCVIILSFGENAPEK